MNARESSTLIEPKTNRSRTEVGRAAVELIRSHELVRAAEGGSEYDVQFFETDRRPESLRPVLEPKTNRSRAEVGRAVFDHLRTNDEVWVGGSDSDHDVQLYVDE